MFLGGYALLFKVDPLTKEVNKNIRYHLKQYTTIFLVVI